MDEIVWESETVNPWCGCDVIAPESDAECTAEGVASSPPTRPQGGCGIPGRAGCYAERLMAERHEQDRVD
jgi:hypothetical protein